MAEQQPQEASARDLIATAQAVAAEVQSLRGDLASKRSLRRTWRIVAFDIVLSLVGLALWYSQVQTNHRLEQSLHQNYATSQEQAETRVRVLCPTETALLVLLSLPRPATAPALSVPQQKALTSAIQTFTSSYKSLKCPAPPSG